MTVTEWFALSCQNFAVLAPFVREVEGQVHCNQVCLSVLSMHITRKLLYLCHISTKGEVCVLVFLKDDLNPDQDCESRIVFVSQSIPVGECLCIVRHCLLHYDTITKF